MWKNLENCITKQTHQRDTPERRRETRESAPFPDRRDQQGVKRVTNDCALSRKLSLKRSHSGGATKTEFIHSGSPFHHHQNARESLRSVPLSSVCGKEKTRETTKNAKGSALCDKSQSCPPLWCVHRVLLHPRIRFLFCCVCVRGRRRRSFERTKYALSRSIVIFFDDRFITDDDTFRFRRVLCSTLSCFGDDDASATD